MTPEQRALEEHKEVIKSLQKEAEGYNNPEQFAKFGKINRLILKMQKELAAMETECQNAAPVEQIEESKIEAPPVVT